MFGACGVYINGQWVQRYTGQLDDPRWRIDIINWLTWMQQALHHLRLILNDAERNELAVLVPRHSTPQLLCSVSLAGFLLCTFATGIALNLNLHEHQFSTSKNDNSKW